MRYRQSFLLLGILSAWLGTTPAIAATTLTFSPVADTSIKQYDPDRNFGTESTLWADGVDHIVDFLIRFDVTGIGTTSVQSAILRLYVFDRSSVGIRLYTTSATTWDERTVTWKTAPPIGTLIVNQTGTTSTGWLDIPVTMAVRGDEPLAFRAAANGTNGLGVYSRESAYRPQLIIVTGDRPVASPPDNGSTSLSASAGPDQAGLEGADLSFTGAASGGTGPYSYSWTFGDGGNASGNPVVHRYQDNGTFTVSLTVRDSSSQMAQATARVTMVNVAPSVNAGGPYSGTVDAPIELTATVTDASKADTTAGFSISWDLGDGASGTGAQISHAYATAGTYTAHVTATDKDGGKGTGSATVTIGSTGAAPLPLVTGSCLDPDGPDIVLRGAYSKYDTRSPLLAAGTKIDARAASWTGQVSFPIDFAGVADLCWYGGVVQGTWPEGTTWDAYHSTAAFYMFTPSTTVQALRVDNYGDGFHPSSSGNGSQNWTLRGAYFTNIHDDCIENDEKLTGLTDDSLFECYNLFSARSSASGPNNVWTIQNTLAYLKPMTAVYKPAEHSSPGTAGIFKWDSTGPLLSLHDNIFRVDMKADVVGLNMPAGKLLSCSNNVIVWLEQGPFPGTGYPSTCFTITTDKRVWDDAVADWHARHPEMGGP